MSKAIVAALAAILKATGEKKQGAKEDDQDFRGRLATAINDMDEDDYEELPQVVKDWYERVVPAADKGKPLPDFAEETKAAPAAKGKLKLGAKKKQEEEEEEEEEEETPKAKKGAKGKVAAKAPAKKAAVSKKVAKEKKPRFAGQKDKPGYRSMADCIRHIVITKPKFDFEEVKAEMKNRGFTGYNESRAYDNFIHATGTIGLLKELGKL